MQVALLPLISDRAKVVACFGLSFCLPTSVVRRSDAEQRTGAVFVRFGDGLGEALGDVLALGEREDDAEAEADEPAESDGCGDAGSVAAVRDGVLVTDGVVVIEGVVVTEGGVAKALGVTLAGAGAVTGG